MKLKLRHTNVAIQPYQSYRTRAHGKAVRLLHEAFKTHVVLLFRLRIVSDQILHIVESGGLTEEEGGRGERSFGEQGAAVGFML